MVLRGGGREPCAIADTYWQSKAGGHMITTLPGATPMHPGCAGRAFFEVDERIKSADRQRYDAMVKESFHGKTIEEGCLVFAALGRVLNAPSTVILRAIFGLQVLLRVIMSKDIL